MAAEVAELPVAVHERARRGRQGVDQGPRVLQEGQHRLGRPGRLPGEGGPALDEHPGHGVGAAQAGLDLGDERVQF